MSAVRRVQNLPKEMPIQNGNSPIDPWAADTNRSSNSAFQPQSFTSYTRDSNGDQDAQSPASWRLCTLPLIIPHLLIKPIR